MSRKKADAFYSEANMGNLREQMALRKAGKLKLTEHDLISDWISHEEAEKQFKKALRIPYHTRIKWWLEDVLRHVLR